MTWTYRYDPFGRRYSKTSGTGLVTVYLPDANNNEVGEYDGVTKLTLRENAFDRLHVAPAAVLTYTAGAYPVATFNHADRLGSVVAESSGGTLTGQYKYDAWGQSATLTGTGFGYAGYRYDAETGLYYVRARYLDPRLGRFVSPDPLGQKPSLNVYGYAAGDPLNQIDPLGLTSGSLSGSADTDSSLIQSAANFVSNHPLASLAVIATVAIGGGPEDPVTDAIAADEIAAADSAASALPSTLARVIPNGIPAVNLGAPGAADVFVTTPEAIEGLDAAGIAQRLTIPESPTGFQIIQFPTPEEGLASPVFRTNPGFVGGGFTAGGAPEYVIPNGPIPPGATITTVP